jgi:hypothetical protein
VKVEEKQKQGRSNERREITGSDSKTEKVNHRRRP